LLGLLTVIVLSLSLLHHHLQYRSSVLFFVVEGLTWGRSESFRRIPFLFLFPLFYAQAWLAMSRLILATILKYRFAHSAGKHDEFDRFS
jgi:hypothetical protein